MEKRVVFASAWLPYALLAPQIVITIVFFFLPAFQAVWFSFQLQDAFGLHTEFVGLQNFKQLFADENYLNSFKVTAVFSTLVAVSGIAISLLLATMADRVLRGALAYKTFLIWPYAVAPAVAGVLWLFLFASPMGVIAFALRCIFPRPLPPSAVSGSKPASAALEKSSPVRPTETSKACARPPSGGSRRTRALLIRAPFLGTRQSGCKVCTVTVTSPTTARLRPVQSTASGRGFAQSAQSAPPGGRPRNARVARQAGEPGDRGPDKAT